MTETFSDLNQGETMLIVKFLESVGRLAEQQVDEFVELGTGMVKLIVILTIAATLFVAVVMGPVLVLVGGGLS